MQDVQSNMPVSASQKHNRLTALILGLVAIALYAPLIGWGLPYATAPDRTKTFATDEILPLEALAEMHNTFVVSKPDRNYGYPWWHYFIVALVQAPYLIYLLISGRMQSPAPDFPFGLQDPVGALQVLTLIGRTVSVLMAAGVVIAAYYFAKNLWGYLVGLITGLLTMFNYLMFYYARTGNLDVPMFFWSSIGLVIFAKIMVDGLTIRRAAWLGVFAGLAMATKDQAVLLFLPYAFVLLLPRFNHLPGYQYQLKPLLIGLGTSVLAYLIGTGMVVDPQRHITHVYALLFDQERVAVVSDYWSPHPKTWGGFANLSRDFVQRLVTALSPPVLVTAVAGVLLVLKSSAWRLILLLPVAALFFLVYLPTGFAVLRYILPFILIINAFAAYAVVSLRRSYLRPLWVPSLIVLCGWPLLIGADLTFAQYYETRYAASAWLKTYAQPGDQIEYFGGTQKIPHLPAEIKTQRIAGRLKWKGESGHGPSVLQYLVEQGPEYLLIIPDWTSQPGMDHSADNPPEVYAALINGSVGYAQVAFFPTPSLPLSPLPRPSLDNPSVSPPVRIFARNDILNRPGHISMRGQN